MSNKLFLVSGASGSVGSKMVRILLERGHKVRAMVHKQDERSENLKQQGAETVVCDFLELKGLRLALAGVSGAYFGYPVAPGLIEAAAFFAQAAKETHLEIIVNMSQVSARSDAFSDATIAHWMSERVFDWSGVKTTHIRPTFFFDWFLYFAKGAQAGLIQMPFDQNRLAFLSAEDLAYVSIKIMENPSEHHGKTYNLYGPEQYSFEEAYQKISQALNHKIKYERIPVEAWIDNLKNFLPPRVLQHFRNGPYRDMPSGVFSGPADTLNELLGRKPTTLAEFANDYRDVLSVTGSNLTRATGYPVG
jgi:uncharacterized protein YbjT (DUF2867 family)